MTTTIDAGLDLRGLPGGPYGARGRVAARLCAMAHAGPAALYSVAHSFLMTDFIRVDELDHLSDVNLACVTFAVQECAPQVLNDWHVILTELGAS